MNILLKKSHTIVTFIACIALWTQQASAQTQRTDDGRFIGTVKSYNIGAVTNDFLDEVELQVEWWTLIGQPVHMYGFKYVPSGEYQLPDGRKLSRAQLVKHSDLQARFDDLRPSQVEVEVTAEFFPRNTGGSLTGSTDRLLQPNHYSGGAIGARNVAIGTLKTKQFQIGRPNEMTSDFSPGSPASWEAFIKWRFGSIFVEPDETSAKNTFKEAQSFELVGLKVVDISLPDARAEAILEDFERREKEEGNAVEDEESIKDDPWASVTEPVSELGEVSKPEPGLDSRKSKDPWASVLSSSEARKDPWAAEGSGTASSRKNPWAQNTSSSDFKTEKRGSTSGVISISGEVLIPFRNWEILRYDSGVAKVKVSRKTGKVPSRKASCNKGPGVRCLSFGEIAQCYYNVTESLVDSTGTTLEVLESYSYTSYC